VGHIALSALLVEIDEGRVVDGVGGGGVGCFQLTGPPDDGDRNFSLPCITKILFMVSSSPTPIKRFRISG